jgi:hypothetical protein
MNRRIVIITATTGAGALLALGACGTAPSVGKTTTPTATASAPTFAPPTTTDPNGQSCAVSDLQQGYCPGDVPAATPSSSPVTTGPLGTTFTVTTQDNQGQDVSYTVKLTNVDQHAGLGAYETLNNPNDHMAAARFTVSGVTGQVNDNANSNATAIGTDTTAYSAAFNSITDGPNFNSGEFTVAPGETVSGWVAFEVPSGQRVASIQWAPGYSGDHATWTLAS